MHNLHFLTVFHSCLSSDVSESLITVHSASMKADIIVVVIVIWTHLHGCCSQIAHRFGQGGQSEQGTNFADTAAVKDWWVIRLRGLATQALPPPLKNSLVFCALLDWV